MLNFNEINKNPEVYIKEVMKPFSLMEKKK